MVNGFDHRSGILFALCVIAAPLSQAQERPLDTGSYTAEARQLPVALQDSFTVEGHEAPRDTAQIIVGVARVLQREGRFEESEVLARYVISHYRGTPAAQEARDLLTTMVMIREAGSGHTQFIVWNTVFATWLGLAIPLSAGADSPEAYGAGLLFGPSIGFFGSRAYANTRPISLGQAGAYTLATVWGTWQAIGWRAVWDVGREEEAAFRAAVLGGLVGVGVGVALTHANISSGDMTLADHAAVWGTWYGLALGAIFELEDNDLLTSTLIGGNVGILAAVPAARAWSPSRRQVRLASAAGFAAGVAGFGLDLLFQVDNAQTAIAIPTVTSAVGLFIGASLVRGERGADEIDDTLRSSLLTTGNGSTVGFPMPQPGTVTVLDSRARRRLHLSWELMIFETRF